MSTSSIILEVCAAVGGLASLLYAHHRLRSWQKKIRQVAEESGAEMLVGGKHDLELEEDGWMRARMEIVPFGKDGGGKVIVESLRVPRFRWAIRRRGFIDFSISDFAFRSMDLRRVSGLDPELDRYVALFATDMEQALGFFGKRKVKDAILLFYSHGFNEVIAYAHRIVATGIFFDEAEVEKAAESRLVDARKLLGS